MTIPKRKPAHPGGIIRRHYLEPLNISIVKLAEALNISRKTASKIVNENGSITPEMALRLSRAFHTTPELWTNLQTNYDLWSATQNTSAWRQVQPMPMVMAV